VEPLPLARDVERQLVDRAKRSEEADIAAVADAPVPEVDRLPGRDVYPDARHAARRIVLNVEDAVGLLEKPSADELLLLRIESGEDGMRLQPLAVPGRREIGTIRILGIAVEKLRGDGVGGVGPPEKIGTEDAIVPAAVVLAIGENAAEKRAALAEVVADARN